MLYYPCLVASIRKNEIDLTIQHSVTYLYAMSRGGIRLNDAIKSLAKNSFIYGESANELGRIARDLELGQNSLQVLNNLIDGTPSRKMKDFLKGLISVINSKGSMTEYMKLKAQQYHNEADNEQKNFVELLGSLSEVYVVALVAGPMFLLVVGIVMGMVGSGFGNLLFAVVYGYIPFASLAFFVLVSSLSGTTTQGIEVIAIERELKIFKDVVVHDTDEVRVKELIRKISKKKRMSALANPFKDLIMYPKKSLFLGIFIAAIYLIYIFSNYKVVYDNAGIFLITASVIATLPFSLFYEIRSRNIRQVENRLPLFLRRLANASGSGLTLIRSIEMALSSEVGSLANEIKKVVREAKWGSSVNVSLIRMSHRVRTPLMTRMVALIVKASEATGNITSIMNVAAEEVESESKLKQERMSITFIYLLIIYMTFLCFLFIAVIISKSFLPFLPTTNSGIGFGASMNVSQIKTLMFHAASLNGFFSGLIAGQIVNGQAASGVKHSILMLLMAYITFSIFL